MPGIASQVYESDKYKQIRKNRNKFEQNRKVILTCVRRLAPIASQSSALPSGFGGSERLRKKAIKFYKCINCQVSTQRTEQEMQAVSVCFT